jgi:serine/threonine protein kinase/Tol biopolymer transport system component
LTRSTRFHASITGRWSAPLGERRAFLDEACAGNETLRRETKLGRDVAIKVLPAAFMADPPRRARFEREARLLATLNHPNIAQVYGLEESDGAQALVMELVPGETLAALLRSTASDSRTPRSGLPLSVDRALFIARQIVDAVDAAHEKGVLHRDLKPANVRITPEGVVKVLDFGLAKAFAIDPSALSVRESKPPATPGATGEGVILGTGDYMSPEQARGLPVDKRTDIWAFGCVLYEMLTGRRAFEGPTLTDTLAAILEREPDWQALPSTTPPRVRELLERCLVKDPRRRLRDIGDARSHLESLEPRMVRSSLPPAAARTRERLWMSVAALTTLVALVVIGWSQSRFTPVPDEMRFEVHPPAGYTWPPLPGFLAMSPNGRHLAFVAVKDGRNQLFVRDLDKVAPLLLPGTEGAWQPAWSPDSRYVAFKDSWGAGRLKRVDIAGGAPLPIADYSSSVVGWSRGGVILLTGRDGRLYRIPDKGGTPGLVVDLDPSRKETSISRPVFLPDGRRFIFQAGSPDTSKDALFLSSLDGAPRTHLLDVLSKFAYADGYLLFQRDGTLMAQPFDEQRGRLIGGAVPVIETIRSGYGGFAAFSIADNGTLAYQEDDSRAAAGTLAWFDQQGKRIGTVAGPGSYEEPSLSPDGRRLAVCRKVGRNHDIWVVDLERNVQNRLTTDPAVDDFPVWSNDSKHLIFASNRKGVFDLYRRAADGSGTDEVLFASADTKQPTDVSSDGKHLLFTARPLGRRSEVWGLTLTGDRKPFRVLASSTSNQGNAVFSPDREWIAYYGGDSGGPEIYLQPFPPTGERIPVSTAPAHHPKWSADGKRIFYNGVGALTVVDVTDPRRPGAPKPLFPWTPWEVSWVVDRDGQRFLRSTSGDAAAAQPITVIVNWTASLRRK